MFKDEMHMGGKKMNYNSRTWSLGNNLLEDYKPNNHRINLDESY
jgi:hypothetical protein